jgi:hypothetical protein
LLNVQSIFSLPTEEVIEGKYLGTEPIRERLDEQSYQVMEVFKISCLSEVAKESFVPVLLIPTGCGYQDISSIVFAFDYEHEKALLSDSAPRLTTPFSFFIRSSSILKDSEK